MNTLPPPSREPMADARQRLRRPIASLKNKARFRKPDYLEACLKLGRLSEDGNHVEFTEEAWQQIRNDFNLPLGDKIHVIAGRFGQAIRWPCMERDQLTGAVLRDLKPDSPCDKLRRLANAI